MQPNNPDIGNVHNLIGILAELRQAYETVEQAENLLADARKSYLSG